jgi:hypothetical protein
MGCILPSGAAADHDGQSQALEPGHGIADDPDAIAEPMHAGGCNVLIQGSQVSSTSGEGADIGLHGVYISGKTVDSLRFVEKAAAFGVQGGG